MLPQPFDAELPLFSPSEEIWDVGLDEAEATRETVSPIPWRFPEYDVVEEAEFESFPASDPPSWTLGRDVKH